jgi:hypothetical protein
VTPDLPLEPPVFVVGTGRCGSTMLSAMLRDHPHLLSLSEVLSFATDLGGRIAEAFPDGPVDAARFWAAVAGVHPKQATLLRHGVGMDEVLYRPGRFPLERGVPALLQTALPHLTDDPDRLYDEVADFVGGRPTPTAPEHYRALFGWIARRLDKRGWVERSGGSLRIVARLARAFPDARFVHLVRDGRDCALSMRRHPGFRMALIAAQLTEILGVDPYESPDRTHEPDLPDALVPFLPERFDRDAFVRYRAPAALCGHYWSGEILAGVEELGALDPDRLLVLRYEDFLVDPAAPLAQLVDFLGPALADDRWAGRVAGAVRRPRSSRDDLDPVDLGELTDACRPGFAALADLYPEAAP